MQLMERLEREGSYIDGLVRTLMTFRGLDKDSTHTLADEIEQSVDRHAGREAIRFEGRSITYAQFDALANRAAHWGLKVGLKRGDTVALFMTNRPEYLAIWIGLTKIGVATALINSNLTGAPLAHTINVSDTQHVVLSNDLAESFHGVEAQLSRRPQAWVSGGLMQGARDFDEMLASLPATRPDRALREGLKASDVALYVYTSGTTGAPKAAKMPHFRVLGMMRVFAGPGRAKVSDRVYVPLPLYHSTGGLCGVGFALTRGGTAILRRKFSATHFWEEAHAEKATVFFYIGELCRYLVNQPPDPYEGQHFFRLGVGNGLRPEVWERFVARFKIPRILEFYGSTEGNVSFLNFDGKIGAVGRIPAYLRDRLNVRIVKFDVETEQPVRGEDGLCREADVNEPGEAIGEIRADDPRYRFEGYSGDAAQTQRKILRDVFAKGDAWFRTGDLMRQDEDGYFYFVDRIGDTFRWKGENVSTNEVQDVIAQTPGVKEVNVFGVKVADADGRAGMAAITFEGAPDLATLHDRMMRELPPYARPLFLRIQPQIETTGTFKYRKVDLVKDGFDPTKSADPVYFDDPVAKRYVPVTPELFADIQSGAFKL